MKVYRGIEDFKRLQRAVVTSGTFDGVHLGHKKVLSILKESAARTNSQSVIITFWPHPRMVLQPDTETRILTTLEEKIELLAKEKPDHLIIIPFTREFAGLTSETFIHNILIEAVGTTSLIIGYDHRFGKNREGSFEYLAENSFKYGFEVEEIPREDIDNLTVSSTNIRKALLQGNVSSAEALLGYKYFLSGTVIHGDKLGRTIGYPTANLEPSDPYKLIPGNGVYAVTIETDGKKYKGMMNIGIRPTIGGKKRVIEANIFNFSQEIYGSTLKVNFIRFLRSEKKFDSLEDLKNQLKQDEVNSLEVLKNE